MDERQFVYQPRNGTCSVKPGFHIIDSVVTIVSDAEVFVTQSGRKDRTFEAIARVFPYGRPERLTKMLRQRDDQMRL